MERRASLYTWVAAGRVDGEALVVESVQQLAGVAGRVAERDAAMIGLAAWLAKQRDAVVAIRAPFGLPAPVVSEPSWRAFAASFSGTAKAAARVGSPLAWPAVTSRTGPAR